MQINTQNTPISQNLTILCILEMAIYKIRKINFLGYTKKYSIHIAHYENNNVSLGKETNGLYNHNGTTIAYNFIYLQILIFNFESNIMSGYGEQIRECTMVYQRGLASGV